MALHLVRDVLDKSIVSEKHDPVGRVDGIVLVMENDGTLRLRHLEAGATVLARRIHPRFGKWIAALAARYGLRRGNPTRIAWSRVEKTGVEIEVSVQPDRTNSLAWENYLRQTFVERLPGGKRS